MLPSAESGIFDDVIITSTVLNYPVNFMFFCKWKYKGDSCQKIMIIYLNFICYVFFPDTVCVTMHNEDMHG